MRVGTAIHFQVRPMSKLSIVGTRQLTGKVRERELMRIEEKRVNTESENGYPEVNQISRPERQCHIEQH